MAGCCLVEMETQKDRPLDAAAVFKALGHPARLKVARELAAGERCVFDLVTLTGLGWSTVSRHLSVMREAGVLAFERRGQQLVYRLELPCVPRFIEVLDRGGAAGGGFGEVMKGEDDGGEGIFAAAGEAGDGDGGADDLVEGGPRVAVAGAKMGVEAGSGAGQEEVVVEVAAEKGPDEWQDPAEVEKAESRRAQPERPKPAKSKPKLGSAARSEKKDSGQQEFQLGFDWDDG